MSQIYVPKSKAVERDGKYGKFLCLSFRGKELRDFLNEHIDGDGYLHLNVSPRKEIGQYGDTHSITKNQWKPQTREGMPVRSPQPPEPDLPPNVPAGGEEPEDFVPF